MISTLAIAIFLALTTSRETVPFAVGIALFSLCEYFSPALCALSRMIANDIAHKRELKHVELQAQITRLVTAAMAAPANPVIPAPNGNGAPAIPAPNGNSVPNNM